MILLISVSALLIKGAQSRLPAATLTLQTEPGKSYYVWQEVKIGFWKARSRLHAVDESTGRKAVVGCDLGELAEAPQKTALRGAL